MIYRLRLKEEWPKMAYLGYVTARPPLGSSGPLVRPAQMFPCYLRFFLTLVSFTLWIEPYTNSDHHSKCLECNWIHWFTLHPLSQFNTKYFTNWLFASGELRGTVNPKGGSYGRGAVAPLLVQARCPGNHCPLHVTVWSRLAVFLFCTGFRRYHWHTPPPYEGKYAPAYLHIHKIYKYKRT